MMFEEAYKIAKATLAQAVGDQDLELKNYEKAEGHRFIFSTKSGLYQMNMDEQGRMIGMNRSEMNAPLRQDLPASSRSAFIDQHQAVEIALSHAGGGRVVEVEKEHGGYEVEIAQGMGRKVKVFVSSEGRASVQKKARFGEMFDLDL